MPLIAGTLIDEARGLHPSFDEQTHPNKVCLQFLSRWQKSVLQRALIRYPELMSDAVLVIPLPLADFALGYALPSLFQVLEGDAVYPSGRKVPFTLIPFAARHDPQPAFSGWILNQTLYLSGDANDWNGIALIELRQMVTPADLTALTGAPGTLVLPDSGYDMAVNAVASFMANRQIARGDLPLPDATHFAALAAAAELSWLDGLWLLQSATVTHIRDVM